MKEKNNKIPKSALAMYVKLNWKKRGASTNKQNNLAEATQSWVSLSKAEKQYFINIFKKYETNLKNKFALNLQNAQPYLKKKHEHITRSCKINEDLSTEIKNVPQIDSNVYIKDQLLNEQTCHSPENEIQCDNEQPENCTTITFENVHSTDEQDMSRLISEPTPPVRSSMELFDIIRRNDDSLQNVNWNDLSKSQKRKYQRALLTIKHNYLKHYTEYLEHLNPEQLFYYYKSKYMNK